MSWGHAGRLLLTCCQVSDFPADYPPFTEGHHDRQPDGSLWDPDAVLSHGGSCIIGPLGTFIAQPVWDAEAIVYGELCRSDLIEAKVSSVPCPDVLVSIRLIQLWRRWTSTPLAAMRDRMCCEYSNGSPAKTRH